MFGHKFDGPRPEPRTWGEYDPRFRHVGPGQPPSMRFRDRIMYFLMGPIASAILYIILGFCLCLVPMQMINIVCKIAFGVVLIVVGVYHLAIHLFERLNATLFDMFSGVILVVMGTFIFRNPQIVLQLLPVIFGSLVIADSLWTLRDSLRLRSMGTPFWTFTFIASVVFIAVGVIMITDPFDAVLVMVRVAGYLIIADGIFDIIFVILIKKSIKAAADVVNGNTASDKSQETVDAFASDAGPVYDAPPTGPDSDPGMNGGNLPPLMDFNSQGPADMGPQDPTSPLTGDDQPAEDIKSWSDR